MCDQTVDESALDVGTINISLPFPGKVSEDLDMSRAQHYGWVASLGLWPSKKFQEAYIAADFPSFIAHTYPVARVPDLDLVTDFGGWSWLFDDSFDKPGTRKANPQDTALRLGAIRQILRNPSAPAREDDPPLLIAWRQILNRIPKDVSENWHHKHHLQWDDALKGYQKEAENNANGHTPTFDEFLRRPVSGVTTCFY